LVSYLVATLGLCLVLFIIACLLQVDIHTTIRRARNAGYKVPFDIFQSYLADEQKRRAEPLFDGQIGTETRAVSKHRCVQSALWWLK
jgi:hypothetical protein